MTIKKKLVLIPSAYNHKAMGDIENFIKYYKEDFDVYVITDSEYPSGELIKDGVCYINSAERKAKALLVTADYIIDAGTVSGNNKFSASQKRISVWHGIPYKKMFADLDKKYIPSAVDYADGYDLMISPSEWYTEHFLRDSMLYRGDVLETAVSRTDSLFISDDEKEQVRRLLKIPAGNKILLYAPTYRERGEVALPFSVDRLQEALGSDWSIVVKLHYLNELKDDTGVIDATDYPSINNLLAVSDLMITDYSSLLFDYSILEKPAIIFQYDRAEYEANRAFMFDLEDYLDQKFFSFDEESLYELIKNVDLTYWNLERLKQTFYPNQLENSTEVLIKQLKLDSTRREIDEVIFLVNELNQIGGVHSFVTNLAREFKNKYNAKIILIGNRAFDRNKEKVYLYDDESIDIKLCVEKNKAIVRDILSSTNGYVISCQFGAHREVQKYLKGKKAVLMFHGDTKDVIDRGMYSDHLDGFNEGIVTNYRRLVFITKSNADLIKNHLRKEIREKTIYIENGIPISDSKSLYKENGEFAFVARLDPDKNPMDAIDIFADSDLLPGKHLNIYGDGSLRPEIEKRIVEENLFDRIKLHGYVDNHEEIYKDKQGVILVSLSEGFGLTLAEAIKYGIPVYAYNSFTACNDIISETTGVKVKVGDKKGFVQAINNPFDYHYFNNDETIRTFSNDEVTEKWYQLFVQLDEEVAEETRLSSAVSVSSKNVKKPISKRIKRKIKKVVKKSGLYQALFSENGDSHNTKKRNNNPLVSIIMPFYNNGDTVGNAVMSVEKNGYNNYEIILINDGSAEDPRPLLKKYKKIRYYYKENGGLSSARNYALDKAKGKYVLFLDSDDVLFPGGLKSLVDYAEENKLEMVSGLTMRVYVTKQEPEYWYKGIYKKDYVSERHNRFKIINDTIATGKLYNLEMLNANNIRFKDGLYEDILFTGQLYSLLDEIGVVKEVVQKWMVYGSGTTITTSHSIDNVKARLQNVDAIFDLQTDLMKVYYTEQFINHHLIACIYGFNSFAEHEKKELFEVLKQGIKHRRDYIVDALITRPSNREVYQSLLDDDYERFAIVAEGFSTWYVDFHHNN